MEVKFRKYEQIYTCRCGKKYVYLKCLKNHQAKHQHAPIINIYFHYSLVDQLRQEVQELRRDVEELKQNGITIANGVRQHDIDIRGIKKEKTKIPPVQEMNFTFVIKEMNVFFETVKKTIDVEERAVKPSELFKTIEMKN